jgi:uncharacterized membrane protein YcaP (DUF421 family)
MKKEEIFLSDVYRILFGNAPIEFLLEVLIRTIIIYLVLIVVLRIMGKRMSGQLTISELAVMVTLGAIVSAPMQIPERGILQGVAVLIFALFFQRGLNYIAVKNKRAEKLIQGEEDILVKDAVMQLKALAANKISKQQLFASLRNEGIYNLGEVDRVYIEAAGLFSIFHAKKAKPGLSLFPDPDHEIHTMQYSVQPELMVCCNCGTTHKSCAARFSCEICGHKKCAAAIQSR